MSTKPEDPAAPSLDLDQFPSGWLIEIEEYSGINPLEIMDGSGTMNTRFLIATMTCQRRLQRNDHTISFEEMEGLPLSELVEAIVPPTPEASDASTRAATGGSRGSSSTASNRGTSRTSAPKK